MRWRPTLVTALLIATTVMTGITLAADATAKHSLQTVLTPAPSQVVTAAGPGRAVGRGPLVQPKGRPQRAAPLPDENRNTPATATTSSAWVSGIVAGAPVFVADVALPWRYHLSRAVVERFDEAAIHDGVADWNGHPGTRWAAEYAGLTNLGRGQGDGQSTVFLEPECEGLTNANAYIYTDGGIGIHRYGSTGTQILEVDIGLCPRLETAGQVQIAIRHEVGHVAGLGHVCDPLDECHQSEMGDGGQACRVMYWQARNCQTVLTRGDIEGLQLIYPTLHVLSGPTPETTLARVAYGTVDDRRAATVVVVSPDVHETVRVAAAGLAARSGGVLLQGVTGHQDCLSGTAAVEANRGLQHRGTLVLVGDWAPGSCAGMAFDWDVAVRIVDETDSDRAVGRLAGLAGPTDRAVVVGMPETLDGVNPGVVPAVAMAGILDAAIVPVRGGSLGPATREWLFHGRVTRATLVGGGPVLDGVAAELRDMGISVDVLDQGDPIDTALAVADRAVAFGARGVTMTVGDGSVESLGGAVLAARQGTVVLPAGAVADPRIVGWLTNAAPTRGWLVGQVTALPQDVRLTYGALFDR